MTFYHSPEDPVSDAVAQLLPRLQAGFDGCDEKGEFALEWVGKTVAPTAADAELQPRLKELQEWNFKDVEELAKYLNFTPLAKQRAAVLTDSPELLAKARRILLIAEASKGAISYLNTAEAVSKAVHSDQVDTKLTEILDEIMKTSTERIGDDTKVHLTITANRRAFERAGQWQSGMLYYGGQFYGGLDRMLHLEERLWALVNHDPKRAAPVSGMVLRDGLATGMTQQPTPPAVEGSDNGDSGSESGGAKKIDLFLSLRSPYSYLIVERLLAHGAEIRVGEGGGFFMPDGTEIVLKPMLPNAMRGVPIPAKKRMYIFFDAARVAHRHGIPFGFVRDPLGDASKNILSVVSYLQKNEANGSEWAYLHEAMKSSWAKNMPLLTEAQCKGVANRSGVSPDIVTKAFADDSWLQCVEANCAELATEGHWGVPAFKYDGKFTWGQDRLWVVERWMGMDGKPEN